MPADSLALIGARAFAGSVMTKFVSRIYNERDSQHT